MKRTIIVALSLILVLLAFTSCEEGIHVHTWDKGEVTKAASCTEDGEVVYKCACGEKKTEVIKATGHKLEKTVVDPTYLKKGSVTVKCSECDEYPVSTYTLDRKDAVGFGGELKYMTHKGQVPVNPEEPEDPDTYIYISFVILPNNELRIFYNYNLSVYSDSETVYLDEDISDYVIKEKVDGEGNVSYSISVNGMECPVTENEGKLTVVFPIPINMNDTINKEITLTPDFHVHTGEEKKYCVNTNTPGQQHRGKCMYFDCETEQCLDFGETKVNVEIVTKRHSFPETSPGNYDPCEYCGVQYNLH